MSPVLIFGAGAIGQWLGALILSSGSPVQLHGRAKVKEAIAKRGGICLDGCAPLDIPFSSSLDELKGRTFSTVICTVKTYAVQNALSELQSANIHFQDIVSFQNGWGSEPMYLEAFPRKKLWTLTTTRAIKVEAPGSITSSPKGGLAISPWESEGKATSSPIALRKLSIPLVQPRSGKEQKWSKLLLNVMGNASGAVTGLSPVDYAKVPRLMRLEILLVREAMAVGTGLGLKRVVLPGFDIPLFCGLIERLPLAIIAPIVGKKMARARGEKLPSLFEDVADPKSSSEVDDMNGAVVREGAKLGMATPLQSALMEVFHRCRREPEFWNRLRTSPERLVDILGASPS